MAEISLHGSSVLPKTVADRLRGARRGWFFGREAEIELFRQAATAAEPPLSVLWVFGPGGVGKTTLLGALADEAVELGHRPVQIDLRAIEPSPPAFLAELARAYGAPAQDALAALDRPVLLLDTFEAAPALEDWLRETFVPSLPAGAVTVIAGRAQPGPAWRRDPGWRDLLRVVALRNLGPDEARGLLRRAGVAEPLHGRLVELTHGHPLALSLLLDVLAQDDEPPPLELSGVPDVVSRLVASFVAGVPSPRHRLALEVAARARFTTEGLLRAALGEEDGKALFAWMRGLSFIEAGPHGLFPHDLARDVIDADLRWRDPAAYAQVHRQVRRDVVDRLTTTDGLELQRALADLMFLHRTSPIAPAMWDWDSLGQVYADELHPSDRAPILAMVERHEGRESAHIAAHWLERQPWAFSAFRGSGPEPIGFVAQLSLHEADEDDIARDPAARAAWDHARRHAPPRPGDEVLLARFAMDRDAYQAPSRSFNVLTMRSTQEWLKRPRLAWYYLCFADAEASGPLMAYIRFQRAPEAEFEVGGRHYAVYARDWRREGIVAWLQHMADRELGIEPAGPAEPAAAPVLALSQEEFAEGVRRALRDCCRPDALAANPLVRARLVREYCGDRTSADTLRELIEQAVRALEADPRGAKLARALERTYMKPAPTQEAAAELLGLPFSTYRGHLTRGVERVADWLWQRELYGP
jgi:hypothetical protein